MNKASIEDREKGCTCDDDGIPWHNAPDCPMRSCLEPDQSIGQTDTPTRSAPMTSPATAQAALDAVQASAATETTRALLPMLAAAAARQAAVEARSGYETLASAVCDGYCVEVRLRVSVREETL